VTFRGLKEKVPGQSDEEEAFGASRHGDLEGRRMENGERWTLYGMIDLDIFLGRIKKTKGMETTAQKGVLIMLLSRTRLRIWMEERDLFRSYVDRKAEGNCSLIS
jgi:hypothetical protein